jgi:hypothetical protein
LPYFAIIDTRHYFRCHAAIAIFSTLFRRFHELIFTLRHYYYAEFHFLYCHYFPPDADFHYFRFSARAEAAPRRHDTRDAGAII